MLKFTILGLICLLAFSIRLFAVVRYESVIHEFDPYFNFRTTKYLAHEGFLEFLNWFDDRGWYPLGRTIGGTIYPGLMLTAAVFYWVMHFLHLTINIRNMCVFIAPIFSALAAISSYLLTTEVTKRSSSGLLAAAFTAVVPSYISRYIFLFECNCFARYGRVAGAILRSCLHPFLIDMGVFVLQICRWFLRQRGCSHLRTDFHLLPVGEIGAYWLDDVVLHVRTVILLHGGGLGWLCVYHQHYPHLHRDHDRRWSLFLPSLRGLLGVLHVGLADGHDRAVCRL